VWLGEGIAALATVLDPAAIAVGGGVGEAGDLILDPVRAAFARHLSGLPYRPLGKRLAFRSLADEPRLQALDAKANHAINAQRALLKLPPLPGK